MYRSMIDYDLKNDKGLNYDQIRESFRRHMTSAINLEAKSRGFKQFDFYKKDSTAISQLYKVYSIVGYSNELINKEKEESNEYAASATLKKLKGKFNKLVKKEKDTKPQKTHIEGGQIIGNVDNRPKYIKTEISDKEQLVEVAEELKSKKFLFINELDIINQNTTNSAEKRLMKIHYSVVDENGSYLKGGLLTYAFAENINEISIIMGEEFHSIAKQLINALQ